MNAFIFAPATNSHGNDANGAFRPGAQAFKKINGTPQDIFYFDWRDGEAAKRKKIISKLLSTPCDDPDGLDAVVYFGHGTTNALESAGFRANASSKAPRTDIMDLASAIASVCKHDGRVILYACSSGSLPTSFASALATALGTTDAVVFGHTCVGHSFTNPYVTTFEAGSSGRFVVEPGSRNWRAWVKAIHAGNTNDPTKNPLWAQFPFLDDDAIRARLGDTIPSGLRPPVGIF
jgi:hypothetical protein